MRNILFNNLKDNFITKIHKYITQYKKYIMTYNVEVQTTLQK